MTNEELLSTFAGIEFHVGTLSCPGGDDAYLIVAAFGSDEILTGLADLFTFDEFHEFEKLDKAGNARLSDNGCPFWTVNVAIGALVETFQVAIDEGLVTEEAIRAQVKVWPYGVDRSVFAQS